MKIDLLCLSRLRVSSGGGSESASCCLSDSDELDESTFRLRRLLNATAVPKKSRDAAPADMSNNAF